LAKSQKHIGRFFGIVREIRGVRDIGFYPNCPKIPKNPNPRIVF
jgi:hypothetical protein